jgi:hypothetical protein
MILRIALTVVMTFNVIVYLTLMGGVAWGSYTPSRRTILWALFHVVLFDAACVILVWTLV